MKFDEVIDEVYRLVYYAVGRDSVEKEIGTVLIRNGHTEEWEQQEETLYQTAMTNRCKRFGAAEILDKKYFAAGG